jgi:biotin carboxyl carrier protein
MEDNGPAAVAENVVKQRDTALIGGKQVEVEWSLSQGRLQVRIGDRDYDVEVRSRQGVCWLDWRGKSIEAFVEESGDQLRVSVGEHVIPVEFVDTRKALGRIGHSSGAGTLAVHAPMPGRIVRLLVAQGDEVAMQQGLVVMEAMKMQNEIKAPKAGKVVKLTVTEGAAVGAGDVIAEVGDAE